MSNSDKKAVIPSWSLSGEVLAAGLGAAGRGACLSSFMLGVVAPTK